jgi:hypothetical protein
VETVRTKNVKLCAYLKTIDINPVEVVKIQKGRAEYVYAMSEKDFERYQVAFNQSKFLDYANNLEAIKDLAY